MDERARLALQEQLTQLEQQFGERLQADLAELATLARDLQQTRATGSRRQLMLSVRDTIPKAHRLATAEFATLRLRLLKLGARIRETASRVRLAFAAACPDADLLRHLATALAPAPA